MMIIYYNTPQKKVGDALNCLNCIQLKESPEVLENVLSQVVNAQTPPSKELHLVYLKYARYYYEDEHYVKAMEICQTACTVLRTPMILTLLAKCLIKVSTYDTYVFESRLLIIPCIKKVR